MLLLNGHRGLFSRGKNGWSMKLPIQLHLAKGKVHARTGHEGQEVQQSYRRTLSLTSMLYGVSCQRHALAALPLGKEPGSHYTGGWVGLRAGLDEF